jgi:HD-GYP domain-containing protein (c-di-GMP phosphodiesterase class II)
MQGYYERLNLLARVGKKIGSVSQLTELVKQTTRMTQYALRASASSVLLLDEETDELYFDFAAGEAGHALRKMRLSSESGIAGWVIHHKRPLIVNDVTKDKRFYKKVDEATDFVTRSIICVPLIVHRKIIGVIEVLNKLDGSEFSEEDLETLTAIASVTAMMIENARLQQAVTDGYRSTINALATAVDAKDPYTAGHSQRVMEYALLGGNSLSLSGDELTALEYAGILHDIGKLGIPDRILLKSGPLNPEELLVIEQHPIIGARIINGIPFLEKAKKLVLYHHERYAGGGYPHGLKGVEIPIGASLLSVADAFDTMTTDRAYRSAIGMEQALDKLRRCSGTQFCPLAVDGFIAGFHMTNIVQEAPVAQPILSR